MRRVRRTAAPASLAGPGSRGVVELDKARDFFKVDANKTKSFDFEAYKGEDVRDALRSMFHKKCAYCETFYAPAMPADIEHYRPKGAYIEAGKPKKPGYWWLAMVWTNLLPSCADCNRARRQQIVGSDRKETKGKANQFPLAAGSVRATTEAEVAAERPLLLNPTAGPRPERHLEFLDDGIVRPALVNGAESERGKVTIDVLALQRRDLVEAREVAATETKAAIQHVRDTMADIADFKALPGISAAKRKEKLAELRIRLDRNVAEMEAKAAPATPYSAVAETLVRAFKQANGL
jgi:uncharacterized protein (TIGR02646 family)